MINSKTRLPACRCVTLALLAALYAGTSAAADETLTVTGQQSATVAGGDVLRRTNVGLLGELDTMRTPFSVTGFSEQYIDRFQAKNTGQLLAHDASVRVSSPSGGLLDSFMIRGFPAGQGNIGEVALNGVYGVAPNYQLLTAWLSSVEILKGPGAGLYGVSPNGAVGGVMNAVTKRAGATPISRITTVWESKSQPGGYLDVGRRWQISSGQTLGLRFNGGGAGGNMALDKARKTTGLGALALDYSQGDFRLALDIIDQYQKARSPNRPFSLAPGIAPPPAPNGKYNIAQAGTSWCIRDQSALLRTEYDISDNITLYFNAGGGHSEVARMSEQTPQIINSAGDVRSSLTNYRFNINRYTIETGVKSSFNTGAVDHQLSLQASYYHDNLAQSGISGQSVASNLYRPFNTAFNAPLAPLSVPRVSSSQFYGGALADEITLFDGLFSAIPGVRFQRITANNFAANGKVTSRYGQSALTPMLGLLWHPLASLSFYTSYIEGLAKGDIIPAGLPNAGQALKPYRTWQYEAGIKYDDHGMIASLSAFQITRPGSAFASDKVLEQRNRGLELNLAGEPVGGVRLQGGVMLMNARFTDTVNPVLRGNNAVGVANVQANAGIAWQLPFISGLSVHSQFSYSGKQYVDQANKQTIPAWSTVDVGAAFRTKINAVETTFRFDVLNLFDRAYWSGVAFYYDPYNTIAQGAPRTFIASVTLDF